MMMMMMMMDFDEARGVNSRTLLEPAAQGVVHVTACCSGGGGEARRGYAGGADAKTI